LVEEVGTEVVEGRHRRYYDLTEDGVQALTRHTQRLHQNVAMATAALRRRGTNPEPDRALGLAGGEV